MDLRDLQIEHKAWVDHNFPDQPPHQPLLGLVEEVGELAHARLKMEQGIRGDQRKHELEEADAIGDIVIYLVSYCNARKLSLAACVKDAWNEVKMRDWQANRRDGT